MLLTVYYQDGKATKAISRQFDTVLPEHKQTYWLEKLGRKKDVVGTLALLHYTGRTMKVEV